MTNPTEKILITGASGQLGRELLRQLPTEDIIPKTRESLDITDLENVRRVFAMLQPDVVIHSAAFTNWRHPYSDKQKCWDTNVSATDNIVKTCALEGIPLIFISSGNVYSNGTEPHTENEPLSPSCYFDHTKALGEQALLNIGQMTCPEIWDSKFRYWIVRTSSLYTRPTDFGRNLPQLLLRLSQQHRASEQVLASDIARSPTYLPDFVKSLIWLARNRLEVVSGIYHMANTGATSQFGFANSLSLAAGLGLNFTGTPVKQVENLYKLPEGTIARNASLCVDKWNDYAPPEARMRPWEEALREFASDYKLA
jgi:dTDP-4-dehydrorhamnose reductase